MKPILLTAIFAAAAVSASAASAEEWNAFSRNARLVYLADVGAIYTVGDTTEFRVARVSLQTPAGDYSHKIDEYQIRCGAKQARIVAEIEYGADGAQVERYPEADAALAETAAAAIMAVNRIGFIGSSPGCGDFTPGTGEIQLDPYAASSPRSTARLAS